MSQQDEIKDLQSDNRDLKQRVSAGIGEAMDAAASQLWFARDSIQATTARHPDFPEYVRRQRHRLNKLKQLVAEIEESIPE